MTLKRLWTFALCLAATVAAAAEPIVLKVGEKKTLNLGTLTKVSTGDPRIAEVAMDGAAVVVTGKGDGKSLLIVWDANKKRTDYDLVVGTPPVEPAPSAVGVVRFGGAAIKDAKCDAAGAELRAACTDLARCQAAVSKAPAQAQGHKLLGAALAKASQTADAAKEYETYLLSCPNASDAKMVRKILDDLATARGN